MTNTKSSSRSKTLNIRVTKSEYEQISQKSKEVKTSISNFARNACLGNSNTVIFDGKDLAKKLGYVHEKMQQYHYIISERIEKIQDALEENQKLLQSNISTNNPDLIESLNLQKLRIDNVLKVLTDEYEEKNRHWEEKIHEIIYKTQQGE